MGISLVARSRYFPSLKDVLVKDQIQRLPVLTFAKVIDIKRINASLGAGTNLALQLSQKLSCVTARFFLCIGEIIAMEGQLLVYRDDKATGQAGTKTATVEGIRYPAMSPTLERAFPDPTLESRLQPVGSSS